MPFQQSSAGSSRPVVTGASVGLRLAFATVALVVALGGWAIFRRLPSEATPEPPPHPAVELALSGSLAAAAIAPDGSRVAYAWKAPDDPHAALWLKPVGGEPVARLTDGQQDVTAVAWSADSRTLAFALTTPDGCALWRAAADDGVAERVGDCLPGTLHLDWATDAGALAWTAPDPASGRRTVFVSDVVGGTFAPAFAEGEFERDVADPAYSPDERSLAFVVRGPDGSDAVWVRPADGGAPRPVTEAALGRVDGLDWAATGRSIVFASDRAGHRGLWSVSLTGGRPRPVPLQRSGHTEPSIAATGRTIVANRSDRLDVRSLRLGAATGDVDVAPRTAAIDGPGSERDFTLSRDGGAIAFVSDRSGNDEIWSADRDGANAKQHTEFAGSRPGMPTWSPDGEHLVFDADAEGQSEIWFVARDSAKPRRLTEHLADDRNPVFSRDGQAIYFASNREDGWQIWRLPSDGTAPRRVTRDGGFLARESADGQWLFWVRRDRPGLWRSPVAGGSVEAVLDNLATEDWANWSVTSRGIWYVRRQPTALMLRPSGAAASDAFHVPERPVPAHSGALTVADDESVLLFGVLVPGDAQLLVLD